MWRTVFLQLAMIAAIASPLSAAPEQMQARFDVRVLGFKIGEMVLTGRLGNRAYATEAHFATTGLIRLFRDMGFTMRSDGRLSGRQFLPDSYREEVNTGDRTSSAQMRYDGTTPVLIAGKVADGDVPPLDPATQSGTLDPLTALFAVLRDQPAAQLCKADLPVFDGARRMQVTLTRFSQQGGAITCSGAFRRVAGYPPEELARRGTVPMAITYLPGDDGKMQAENVWLRTTYGRVTLVRNR